MNAILYQRSVLVLNRYWLAINAITPAEAFGHLVAGGARALRIDREAMESHGWNSWAALEVPDDSVSVGTTRGRILVPTVIVLNRYDRMPMTRPGFGFRGLWERDGGRCQYTGRLLTPHEANIDHIVPRSRGGADDWENCVLSDRKINQRKGARTPAEAGLRLLSTPSRPRALPAWMRITNLHEIEDWNHFLPR